MSDFKWEENVEDIFEKCISLSPGPFRKITRNSLNEALLKEIGGDGTVTEAILVACIKEVTPKPFLAMGMKKLKPMLKGSY
jgi:hypothetical protein